MKCPSCQNRNRPDRRFCGQCGAALVVRCSRCGFSNDPSDRFCGGCGDALDAVASAAVQSASPRPVPAATVTLIPTPPPSYGADMLSPQELGELLRKPAPAPTSSLPNRVTQEDLDRLFGVKP